jgi:hypothetical protein
MSPEPPINNPMTHDDAGWQAAHAAMVEQLRSNLFIHGTHRDPAIQLGPGMIEVALLLVETK